MPASTQQKPLLGKFRLTSTLLVETGLHIGGGGENLDIGGLDKPVIRDPLTHHPYIPGSSIRGKLRSILERYLNEPLNRSSYTGGVLLYRHECDSSDPWFQEESQRQPHVGASDCPVCRVFGSTGNSNAVVQTNNGRKKGKGFNYPSRLIVRDCHLLHESVVKLKKIDTGLHMTEWKFENSLDRITSAANPRQFERVPAGSQFCSELIYTVEDVAQATEDLKNIAIALAILEDDALGGHGSRGYGKVKFTNIKLFCFNLDYYRNPSSDKDKPFKEFETIASLLAEFGSLTSEVEKLLPGS